MLNLAQLRSFIVLAEELNFRKAAQRLYVTQPALSKQIRSLEEFVGTDLFQRTHREVHLTVSGAAILEDARALLIKASHLAENVTRLGTDSGQIVIGISMSLEESVQRSSIQHQKRFPNIELVFREISSTKQCEALCQREIDVGFLWTPVPARHLASMPLFKRPLVVALPRAHPLANRKKIKLAQLAKERLLLRPRKSGIRLYEPTLALLRKAGIEMRVLLSTLSPQFAANVHVATGEAICILPENLVKPNRDIVVVPLDEPEAFHTVCIAWRKDEQSPRVLSFIDAVRETSSAKAARISRR